MADVHEAAMCTDTMPRWLRHMELDPYPIRKPID